MKKILVVEDDVITRTIIKTILKTFKYEVLEADCIESTYKIIEEKLPNLIILDLNLFGESGFEILEMTKSHKALKHTPIIITTWSTNMIDVLLAKKSGVTDYLLKPVDNKVLVKKVQKMLS